MKTNQPTQKKLIAENKNLHRRLEEAEQTLEAIRRGEVDALVISGPQGDQVYTLTGAEHSYRVLLEGMNEGAVTMTLDGSITYCNNRFSDMIKVPSTQVINSSIYDLFSPNDKVVLEEILQKKGKTEINVRRRDGTAVPVYLSCTSVELNGIPSLCMVVTDLTEQKKNEERKAIETQYRHIFDDMSEGAIIFGLSRARFSFKNGVIIYSNKSFAKLVKRPLPKVVGSSIFEFISDQDIPVMEAMVRDLGTGSANQREIRLKRDDGGLVVVNFSMGSMFQTAVTYALITDLTEIKRKERESRRLASELVFAQEKERKRIAGELHDGLAANLAAVKMSLQNKVDSITKNRPSEIRIEDVITHLQTNIDEVRRIMSALHPSILDDLGIVSTINWYSREYQKTYPHIQVDLQIEVPEVEFSAPLKAAIYRICQESLNNTAKHSKANSVTLSLKKTNGAIELFIKDNGQGFDLNDKKRKEKDRTKGLGLDSMRDRVELLGGSFFIESSPGAGTTIKALWPI